MAQLRLRPLGVGEIVGATVTVCLRRFGPMFAIALVLAGIPFLVSLVGGCSLDADDSTTCSSPIGWLGYIAGGIGATVAATACSLVAAGAYADVPSNWWRAMRTGVRRTIAIVLAAIVVGVPMGIGIVFVIPGFLLDSSWLTVIGFAVFVVLAVFVAVSFAVAWEALIIEGIRPMEGIKRSWRLVAGERWRVLGAGLLLSIMGAIVFGIVWVVILYVLSPALGVGDGMAGYLGEQVSALLTIPLGASTLTVIYLDLRVRKESLTTDELAAALSEQGYRWENRSDASGPVDASTTDPGQGPQKRRMRRTTAVTLAFCAALLTIVWISRPPPQTTVLVPYDTDNQEIINKAAGLTVLFCMTTEQGLFAPDGVMESILAELPATAAEKGWDSDDIDQVIAGMVYHALGDCEERMLRALP